MRCAWEGASVPLQGESGVGGNRSPDLLGWGGQEEARDKSPWEAQVPLLLPLLSPQHCKFSGRGEVGAGALGSTAKEGARAWALGRPSPPLSILSLRSGNAWEGVREGRCRLRGLRALRHPTVPRLPPPRTTAINGGGGMGKA